MRSSSSSDMVYGFDGCRKKARKDREFSRIKKKMSWLTRRLLDACYDLGRVYSKEENGRISWRWGRREDKKKRLSSLVDEPKNELERKLDLHSLKRSVAKALARQGLQPNIP